MVIGTFRVKWHVAQPGKEREKTEEKIPIWKSEGNITIWKEKQTVIKKAKDIKTLIFDICPKSLLDTLR